jgi:hypothetical protein
LEALDRSTGELHEVLVSPEDLEFASQFTLRVVRQGDYIAVVTHLPTTYALSRGLRVGSTYALASLILVSGTSVDHVNRNTLDNRRENLRSATAGEQSRNRYSINATSGFKGVRWRKDKARWQARVKLNGRQVYSSMHREVADAARAYDEAVKLHHGEFALTNEDLGLLSV